MKKTTIGAVISIGILATVPAWAQQAPKAGDVLRDIEPRTLPAPAPAKPRLQIEQPDRPQMTAPADVGFRVKAFRVTGATVFQQAALEALLGDLTGKELKLADLQAAAARVTNYYRERGYFLARAYVPAQDVREGIVEIAVIEGQYGRVELQNRSRLSDNTVTSYFENLRRGGVIEQAALERAILLLSDLPGAGEPSVRLKPGAATGQSDLVVTTNEASLLSGDVTLDDFGNRFTGSYRLTGNVNINSPARIGDQLNLKVLSSFSGLEYGRVGYTVPLWSSGLKVGAAWAQTHYSLGKDFAALNASGNAQVGMLSASYPFVRSIGFNVSGLLTYDAKQFEDRIGAAATDTTKKSEVVTAGVSLDRADGFGGGGITLASASYVAGELRIQTPAAIVVDDASARTRGHFEKIYYALTRLQRVSDKVDLNLALSGQAASKNLDPSEKLVLGGAYGVRAYPQGEAAADEGYIVTAELRYAVAQSVVPGQLHLMAFLDSGWARLNRNQFAATVNSRHLSGGGVGLTLVRAGDYQVRALYAHKIGSEAAVSDTDRSGRAWFLLSKLF